MDIRNTRAMKTFAAERLSGAPQEKKIVLIYSGIVAALAMLATVIQYLLGLQINQLGGLSHMGTRTILSTIQSMLPLVQSLVLICLELGYVAAMLRVARGQYASPNTLRLGFSRFWTLVRVCIIRGIIYAGLIIGAVYLSSMIFTFSPWGDPFVEMMDTLTGGTSLLNSQIVLNDAMILQLLPTLVPMLIMAAVLVILFVVPVALSMRMVGYVIIDKPALRPMAALRESRKMMRGNCMKLLKLDLSFWWYYVVMFLISALANLDQLLALVGIGLPIPEIVAFFGFYIAYLLLQMVVFTFLRNRLEVTYSLFYDSVKPEEPKDTGVVLGNIFTM